MLVLASPVLGFAMFGALRGLDLVSLHSTLMRPCSNVTIWEASLDAELLRAYPSLFYFARCYAYHACLCHPLAFYASLNAYSHVHAWVLLASVSSMLQHNEVMDIRSKPTFVPCRHHLLSAFLLVCLFACLIAFLLVCLLACLPSRLFACFLVSLLAMTIMFIYSMPLSYALCNFSFHCLSVGFFSLPLHVHTWSEDV